MAQICNMQLFFCMCVQSQEMILQNGTKDSISKLVEDLNAAKYEDDVGEYHPPLLLTNRAP